MDKKRKKVPAELKKILKEEELDLNELVKDKKAHMERRKRLDSQLSAARAERIVEVE